jgi:hypothetical protein
LFCFVLFAIFEIHSIRMLQIAFSWSLWKALEEEEGVHWLGFMAFGLAA